MNRRVIINADDFGLCEGVNKGIIQAYTDGVLTSTTIMANMGGAEEAAKLAKAQQGLGIGVHLNLSEGKALSKEKCVKPLVDEDGVFNMSLTRLGILSLLSRKVRDAIRAELSAQIQWVIDSGLRPTHLDSHKHIHSLAGVFSIVCQLAWRFRISAIRFALEPKGLCERPWPLPGVGGKIKAAKIRTAAQSNRFQNPDFFKTDGLLGVAHMGKIDVTFFKAVSLYDVGSTIEVMTHPGHAGGLDRNTTKLIEQREAELKAICNQRTKRFFEEAGVKLVHYGQL